MDLKKELLKEQSKKQAVKIASFIGNDPGRFEELMLLFFDEEEWRVNQRAAWILSHCMDNHPALIEPYVPRLILNLRNKVPVAIRRNSVRCLQEVEIPEDLIGEAADICFNYLSSREEPVAVKVFAMTILANICLKIPELKNELILIIEDQLPYASAGFRSRAKRVFKQLAHI